MDEATIADGEGRRAANGALPGAAGTDVVVYARFLPNGLVETINYRPEQLSPQEWFDRLCLAAPHAYQPLAGGRGVFRLPSGVLEALWSERAVG